MNKWINDWVEHWFQTDQISNELAMEACNNEFVEYDQWTATSKRDIASIVREIWWSELTGHDAVIPYDGPMSDLLDDIEELIDWEKIAQKLMKIYDQFYVAGND